METEILLARHKHCHVCTYLLDFHIYLKASRSNSLLCSSIYAEIRQSCSCAGNEVIRVSGSTVTHILILSTLGERIVVSFMHRSLYPKGKHLRYIEL